MALLAIWFTANAVLLARQPGAGNEIVAALRDARYSEAKRLSEAALKQSPKDPKLWTLNGMALERLGDSSSALGSYKHALQSKPDYVPALEAAAQLEYARGEQEAVPYLKQLLQMKPEDTTAHAMLAALAFRRGDCPSAATEYQRSRPLIDTQPRALEQFGSCLVKNGKPVEAVEPFERLAALQPENADFRYNLAVVELLAGKPREVIATLTAAGQQQTLDSEALDILAEAYEAIEDTPKAVETLRRAIVENPNEPRYYVDFANISLVHASYQVGIDFLNIGLRRLPNAAQLYVARGILYVKLGEYDKGDADFETAERLDPRIEAAASAEGMSAFEQNHLPEAESRIRERLAKNPKDPFLHYLLAEVLARQGAPAGSPGFNEAIQSARTAIQLQPDFELARDVLGRLYLHAGKTAEAIEQSRIAVREDPNDQTALYHLILALKKAQQTEEVPALLEKFTALRQQALSKENRERHFVLQEQGAVSKPAAPEQR